MAFDPFLQIAAGHNNTAGLTAIESALTTTATAIATVTSFGNYSPGERRFRADGTTYFVGFPSTTWLFSVMSMTQYEEIQLTYCGAYGSFDGLVTIKTNTVRQDAFGNWNATLVLPTPAEAGVTPSRQYLYDVPVRFIQMESI